MQPIRSAFGNQEQPFTYRAVTSKSMSLGYTIFMTFWIKGVQIVSADLHKSTDLQSQHSSLWAIGPWFIHIKIFETFGRVSPSLYRSCKFYSVFKKQYDMWKSKAIDQLGLCEIILIIKWALLCPVPLPPRSRHLQQTASPLRKHTKAQFLAWRSCLMSTCSMNDTQLYKRTYSGSSSFARA